MEPRQITLGAHEYALVPQRIGRIRKHLSAIVDTFAQGEGGDDAVGEVTEVLYEALEVFIPDLAPRWELAGYGSEGDFALAQIPEDERPEDWTDPYDERRDKSPTPPEIIEAVDAIFEIHGGTRLMRLLKSVVKPERIQSIIDGELRAWQRSRIQSALSQTEPSENGESASMSSSTPEETPAPSAAEEIEPTAEQTPEADPQPASAA